MKYIGKILLIGPDKELNEFYCSQIVSLFKYEVINLKDIQSAIKYLISDSNVEMIICHDSFTGVNHVGVLVSFLRKSKLDFPIVIFSENSFDFEYEVIISPTQSPKKSLREISSILNVILSDFAEIALTDFKEIPLFYFYQLKKTFSTCDVFRPILENNQSHFEQLFGANESFSRQSIADLSFSGLNSLYIKEEYYDDFIVYATETIINRLDKDLPTEETLEILNDTFLLVQDRLHKKQVDDTTKMLIQGFCHKCKNLLEKNSNFHFFFNTVLKTNINYPFLRFFLISILGNNVLIKMDMKNELTIEKFHYVNFFHDIYLNKEKLLLAHSEDELAKLNLTKDESNLVSTHARLASELVNKLDFIPHGVADILIEHHGSKNGVGFKNKLSITLSPLSMILIVVEDYSINLLKSDDIRFSPDLLESHCNQLEPIYNKITFKETLVALRNSIKANE